MDTNTSTVPLSPPPDLRHLNDDVTPFHITIDDVTVLDVWSGDHSLVVEVRLLGDSTCSYETLCRVQAKPGKRLKGHKVT